LTRAAARDSTYLHGKRYRISVKQVLKQAWLRHGYGLKGFSLGRHSPPMTRQRFASMRNIAAGDQSSSGRSSSSTISARSTPSLDFDVALSIEDFNQVARLAEDRLVCAEILCEMKSS
jgi:hypothetical protein